MSEVTSWFDKYALTDEERTWIKALDADLWPPEHANKPSFRIKIEALRVLTWREFERIEKILTERVLLLDLISTSMFGGYGVDVYENEPAPGAGPIFLLRLVEGHMPPPHRLQVGEEGYNKHQKRPGEGRDDAWEFFSKFTHTEDNIRRLKSYKMNPPRDRSHYDY